MRGEAWWNTGCNLLGEAVASKVLQRDLECDPHLQGTGGITQARYRRNIRTRRGTWLTP
jgi:hypothetical protein